tara:strand:+ start:3901 stop:4122 length:222 start_codon:yes stop_codon:yes gene_type:complete
MVVTIVGTKFCKPCEDLKEKYPDARYLDLSELPPLAFAMQALTGDSQFKTPIVIAAAKGNGEEARRLIEDLTI